MFSLNEAHLSVETINNLLHLFDQDLILRKFDFSFIQDQEEAFTESCQDVSSPDKIRGLYLITRLLRKLWNNRVTIRDAEMNPIGYGLFPYVTAINHHCQPNAALVFQGNRLILTSLRAIEASEEIRIRYLDSYRIPRIKAKLLKAKFDFECECSICNVALRDSILLLLERFGVAGSESLPVHSLLSNDQWEFAMQGNLLP